MVSDLRLASRTLARHRALSAAAVLTLAVAIGAAALAAARALSVDPVEALRHE